MPEKSRWPALWVLAAGLSMIVLDGTIVGVALPAIIRDLHLSLTDAEWVNSIYAVVFSALLLGMGRLGDRLGRRRLFLAGTTIFVAGSIMAALSGSASTLIEARVVQGLGGAIVLPSTLSSVNALFRGRERAAAFGVWGAVMSGMAAVGPLLGGWLASSYDWSWIFWVNVPFGLAVVIATALLVPETGGPVPDAPEAHLPGVDVDGLQLSAIGMGALVFAIIEGPRLGWWRPLTDLHVLGMSWPRTMPVSIVPVLLVVAAVASVLFVIWERHRARVRRSALLDLTLFDSRRFTWGNITAMTVAVGEFALVFALPLYVVNARGLGLLASGLVIAAMAVGAFVSGARARHLAARLGPATVVVLGLGLEVAGVGLLAVLTSTAVPVLWSVLPLLAYGVGLGLASAQLTSLVLADVPPTMSGQGSATQSTVRQVGSAVGSAIAGTLLSIGLGAFLTGPAAITHAVRSSAGGALASVTDPALHASLASGFAHATQLALGGSAGFLLLGLAGALVLRRAVAAEEIRGPSVAHVA